jgi:hypothetical protein
MGMNTGGVWTPEDDEILRTMVAAGRSAFLIAAKLKRSVNSVQRRGHELGIRVETPAETRRRTRLSESFR